MISRIHNILSHFGINQKDFADKIGVSTGNVTEWFKGRSKPKTEAITKICETFNINANWLLTGTGAMLLTDQPKPELSKEDSALLTDIKDFIIKHSQPFNRPITLNVMRTDYPGRHKDSHTKDKEDAAIGNVIKPAKMTSSKEKIIPLYASKVCAGSGSFAYDDIEAEIDIYRETSKNTDFVLTVTGDSMTYAGIYDGDRVLVRAGNGASINDLVIAELPNGEFTLKRLVSQGEEYWLEPANLHYYSILLTDDIKIVGVVTGVFRKF